jgi:DNA-binding transcriptional ArsR family regulator
MPLATAKHRFTRRSTYVSVTAQCHATIAPPLRNRIADKPVRAARWRSSPTALERGRWRSEGHARSDGEHHLDHDLAPRRSALTIRRASSTARDGVAADDRRRARVNGLRRGEPLLTYNQMVVCEFTDDAVDHLFHALADATRRDIVLRSVRGELSVSRLADAYPMSFAAVQKHVAVLERAGLVTKERHGREQLVRTDPDAVGRARQALDQLETAWRGRVDGMSHLLALVPNPRDNNPRGQGP